MGRFHWRLWAAVLFWGAQSFAADSRLVILTETGQVRDGVPVYTRHPHPEAAQWVLERGFSGRMLRLYQLEQDYLRRASGSRPEPAYLLLSGQRGGFPRFGFYLDDADKRGAGYVDLHKSGRAAGRFGAMDQIFPHELAHIIVRQLAGEPRPGGSNQMHATGVRTDPSQAFQEGFAEHVQLMALEDPDADPATRGLIANPREREIADRQARGYRQDLESRWPFPGPRRMGFILWFSGIEQIWRYFAVKENAFAYGVMIPEHMLGARDLYPAYLLQSVLPGDPRAPVKSVPVLLATEGVVSSLFYRWANREELRNHYRDDNFYPRFGTSRSEVSPVENVYLKVFHVLYSRKPGDTSALIRAYKEVFPDESEPIDKLVSSSFLGQSLPTAPEIWLANRNLQTGSSLFDQFRGQPRIHTFDLNGATLVDLLAVPGMTKSAAEALLRNAPFSGLADIQRVPEISHELRSRFDEMVREMARLRSGDGEDEIGVNIAAILRSYVWRALGMLALASFIAASLYRRIRSCSRLRAAANGISASLLVLALAWITTGTAAGIALAGPLVVFGIPAAAWQAIRHKGFLLSMRTCAAWVFASIPAVVIAYPWV